MAGNIEGLFTTAAFDRARRPWHSDAPAATASRQAAARATGERAHHFTFSIILMGHRIEFGVRPLDVDAREHERRDDDEQADGNAERHDAAGDRRSQDLGGERDDQDEPEIDDQHRRGQGPGEVCALLHELAEQRLLPDT